MPKFCFVLFLLAAPLIAAEEPADHPAVKRMQGAKVFFQSRADFDQLKLALGPLEWSGAEMKVKPYESLTVEGRRLTNYYRVPAGIGTLETFRNYEQDLREQGFEILFAGRGEEVETPGYNNQIAREILKMTGAYGTPEEKAQWPFQHTKEDQAAYIAARKAGESGDVFVSVYIVPNTHDKWLDLPVDTTLVRVDVCEVKAREQRMELVTSAEMNQALSLDGRVALYGILFDFNSAAIKPESEAALAEIAKLLSEKPELRLLVVGHTDAVGSFSFNKELSQKRAEAVVANLASKGVSSSRLFPVGVSFAAPVATNATEEGRKKNRRVELVDLAGARAE
ncbi:MAG: OmpA family protein [Terrimicrobiaceae bacterium]|nr:OmpA family protein [Terrimicrobiaceae bacterium]